MKIENKIYRIEYEVTDYICVDIFEIKHGYRGRGYSRRIFNSLLKKHNKPIILECWPTLFEFYMKLGFEKIGDTYDGYFEMRKG